MQNKTDKAGTVWCQLTYVNLYPAKSTKDQGKIMAKARFSSSAGILLLFTTAGQ